MHATEKFILKKASWLLSHLPTDGDFKIFISVALTVCTPTVCAPYIMRFTHNAVHINKIILKDKYGCSLM